MATAPAGVGIGDALGYGWRGFRENVGPLLTVTAVVIAIQLGVNWLGSNVETVTGRLGVTLLGWIVSFIIGMGWINVALRVTEGRRPELRDLFVTDPIAPYAIATVLLSVAVAIGLVLLIAPGIYLALRYGFYGYGIVDKGLGVADAFRHSSERTEGHRLWLLGLGVVLFAINLVGVLLLGLGLFVTVPVSVVTMAYVYRSLGDEPVVDPEQRQE